MNANKKNKPDSQKVGCIGCFTIIVIIVIVSAITTFISKPKTVDVPEYDIIRVEDLSLGKFIRMNYLISVDDSYSTDDLKTIAESIVESEKSKHPISTVAVAIFSNEDDPSKGVNSIGDIEWGPYGEWAKAMDVEPGDYSKHEYTYNFRK